MLGGRQFKVTANDLIVINRIEADIGEQIFLEKVGQVGVKIFLSLSFTIDKLHAYFVYIFHICVCCAY